MWETSARALLSLTTWIHTTPVNAPAESARETGGRPPALGMDVNPEASLCRRVDLAASCCRPVMAVAADTTAQEERPLGDMVRERNERKPLA